MLGAGTRRQPWRSRTLLLEPVLITEALQPWLGIKEPRTVSRAAPRPTLEQEQSWAASQERTALGGLQVRTASLRNGPIPPKGPAATTPISRPSMALRLTLWWQVRPPPLLRSARRRPRQRTGEAEMTGRTDDAPSTRACLALR